MGLLELEISRYFPPMLRLARAVTQTWSMASSCQEDGMKEMVLLGQGSAQLDINSWDGVIAADSRTLVHY